MKQGVRQGPRAFVCSVFSFLSFTSDAKNEPDVGATSQDKYFMVHFSEW